MDEFAVALLSFFFKYTQDRMAFASWWRFLLLCLIALANGVVLIKCMLLLLLLLLVDP